VVKATPTKSRTPFYGLLLLLGVAGAAGIWYALNANKPAPIVLDAKQVANLPPAEGYLRGNPNAPVTIIEFGDFECPLCGNFATISEPDIRARIIDAGLANFRFFDFPLAEMHKNTLVAHLAASCAADQNKFWEMHDAIFAAQDQWNTQATTNPRKLIDSYAKTVGLDMAKYSECMTSQSNLSHAASTARRRSSSATRRVPTAPRWIA
jgi:protein-disulfide isomerase